MSFDKKVVFVSGTNRGIGKAIVEALLKYPVKKVYASARKIEDLPKYNDSRVVPIRLDISNQKEIRQAASLAQDVDILINNAGALSFASILTGKEEYLKRDMLVNYFGTVDMIQAFVPIIAKKGQGAIANISSIVGLAPMYPAGGYSASKAALHSATQSLRAELKSKHITVHGIYPGPIDTDMSKGFDMPKTSPQVTAENILKGIIVGKEEIYPDPMSLQLGEVWSRNPKGLELEFAKM